MAGFLPVLIGCAADRPLHVQVADGVRRPERAAVLFFVDGFGEKQFDEALAEGRLPNISRHIVARGVRVKNAVACVPTITYANSVTFLTGRYPGRHGVVSNKWFEPSTGRFRDYGYIRTYQQVNGDFTSPTIHELLSDRVCVSIQAAMYRGCTHNIDNWATSGINWFFGNHTGVDCLVAQAFELIGKRSSWWGQWPDFVMVYFPGADTVGHNHGPESRAYQAAIDQIDRQIGRICQALQDVGMYDRTYLVLVSDHGMVPVKRGNVFDIADHLRNRTGARVWFNRLTETPADAQALRECDYVVAASASRWAAVYPVPDRRTGHTEEVLSLSRALSAYEDQVVAGVPAELSADARALLRPWLREAVEHPATELMACSFRPGKIHLFTRNGHAVIVRTTEPVERHVVWQRPESAVIEALDQIPAHPDQIRDHPDQPPDEPDQSRAPPDQSPASPDQSHAPPDQSPDREGGVVSHASGYRSLIPVSIGTALTERSRFLTVAAQNEPASDSRRWLEATANSNYPDLVPQITAMFDSERAGTFVFFAAAGWDFSAEDPAGGHGSILPEDIRVPMVFAGPDLSAGGAIPFARNCDVMPTLLHLLGEGPLLPSGERVDIDGTSLLPCSGPQTVVEIDAE